MKWLRRQFPINPYSIVELPRAPHWVPWSLVVKHSRQAQANHSQTLAQLAERGGLSWSELEAVLENRPWRATTEEAAFERVRAIAAAHGITLELSPAPEFVNGGAS